MSTVTDAAIRAVVQHLSAFADSMAAEDLWENNPELSEQDAIEAGQLADLIARSVSAGIEAMP
jgi:hypothetical protein